MDDICNYLYLYKTKTENMKRIATTLILALAVSAAAFAEKIDFLPLPVSVEYTDGVFQFDKNVVINGGNAFNVDYLKNHLEKAFDFETVSDGKYKRTQNVNQLRFITFTTDVALGQEEYVIEVTPQAVKVASGSRAGEFYAVQTLLQMMPASVYKPVANQAYGALIKSWDIPCLKIKDAPRFGYRGNMFDVSRTFFDKEYILRHLEFLAYHKINKFHWHISDDNGWRIEIRKYPKLTQVGAWRGDNEALEPAYNSGKDSYGGYYTQEEIKEIVKFAAERNIEIIPEIDLPGHSKSAAVAYPEIVCKTNEELQSVQGEVKNVFCAGNENNYKMLDNIFKEIAALFPSQYINIGGDEVVMENWRNCPDCQKVMKKMGYTSEKQLMQYFVERMEKIAAKHGKKIAGWEDIAVAQNISRDNLVVVWHGKNVAQRALDAGFPIVMQNCTHLYMDMKHSLAERGHTWAAIIPVEKVYEFDPYADLNITEEQKSLILGLQGGLWTEMLFYPPHFAEYQLFPRMCAAAEVAWTPQEQRCWNCFESRLSKSHFERMYNMGIRFRLPYPEVKAVKGQQQWSVDVSAPYENTVIRYTTDGSEPTISSPVVNGRIFTDNPQGLRFTTFFGENKSITVDIPSSYDYLKPATKVTTSLKASRGYQIENLAAYEEEKYFRTAGAPVKGDYVLYTFEQPVECSTIRVQTNDPVNKFWGVTDGHVEVSYNGVDFVEAGRFDMYNKVIINNIAKPVSAVKIVCDGPSEGKAVGIRHLYIEK